MKIGKLFLTAVTFCSVASLQAQSGTQIVAHRGYWKTEGSAQNSIASLEKAIEIGCRGSEIDLILTTDGVLVLHHDDAIAGKPKSRTSSCPTANPCRRSTPFWLSPGRRKAPSRSSRSSPIRPSRRRMRPSLPRWTPFAVRG